MKRKLISAFLAVILIMTISMPTIFAQTAQQKKEELEEQLKETQKEKNEVTSQKKDVLEEISELNEKIEKYENEIDGLNSKISKLQKSIEKNEKEIKKLEEEYKEKEAAFLERLVAMYEAGQTTYLDVLLSSESMVNFISNYYMISEVAEADTAMLESIQTQQTKIEETKKELESQKKEIVTSKTEVQEKAKSLNSVKSTKQSKVNSLTAKEKELQKTIDKFNSAIKEAQKEIERELSKNSGYQGSFSGTLSWPLSSSSYGYNYITSVFGPRTAPTAGASSNHGAVDIAVSYQPVYAPADGKVIIAKWLSGYGNYVLIDHGNKCYTGFGHLSAFSVSKGASVKRGQKIATSGNTGISTGPHLHYEVHIGGYDQSDRVDPLKYTTHGKLIYF